MLQPNTKKSRGRKEVKNQRRPPTEKLEEETSKDKIEEDPQNTKMNKKTKMCPLPLIPSFYRKRLPLSHLMHLFFYLLKMKEK